MAQLLGRGSSLQTMGTHITMTSYKRNGVSHHWPFVMRIPPVNGGLLSQKAGNAEIVLKWFQ